MSWSKLGIFWTAFGCFFAPIYITAFICSVVKICRDRKRIIAKNELIRQNREHGIETPGSIKRPNIEIIHDEERAKQFRPFAKASKTSNGSRSSDREESPGKTRNLANGHTTHVTIEHCPSENNLQGHRQGFEKSNSPNTRDESAYDSYNAVETAGSDCSNSIAVTTPSDAGSYQANTDTEIVCESDHPSEKNSHTNYDGLQNGKRDTSSRDDYLHPHRKSSRKEKKHRRQGEGRAHHSNKDRRRMSADENANRSSQHAGGRDRQSKDRLSNGSKSDLASAEQEFLNHSHVRNRRISSGVIHDEEEKRRKDQEYRMTTLRSKSEDNVGRENADGSLFIHEQGRENHAFERSTENTRM